MVAFDKVHSKPEESNNDIKHVGSPQEGSVPTEADPMVLLTRMFGRYMVQILCGCFVHRASNQDVGVALSVCCVLVNLVPKMQTAYNHLSFGVYLLVNSTQQ